MFEIVGNFFSPFPLPHVHSRPELVQQGPRSQKKQKREGEKGILGHTHGFSRTETRPARPATIAAAAATAATTATIATATRRGWSDYKMPPVTKIMTFGHHVPTKCALLNNEFSHNVWREVSATTAATPIVPKRECKKHIGLKFCTGWLVLGSLVSKDGRSYIS